MPPTNRSARGRFQKFVASQQPALNRLPLVHTTAAYSFVDIYKEDVLTPSACDIFKKKILYFFYGRPAYRARKSTNAHIEFSWPIIFIFDPTKIGQLSAIYPFDTGAFNLRLYQEFFHSDSRLNDFRLRGNLDNAVRLVETFYENNRAYYTGFSKKNVNLPLMQFEAQGVQELSRLPGSQLDGGAHRDERSSAIEVQVTRTIDLRSSLLAIVLPQQYLQQKEVVLALDRWDVKIRRYYEVLHNQSSDAWVGQIYMIVSTIFEELGYLDVPSDLSA